MIQYTLKCDQAHSFDSWFKSSDAFDKLAAAGHVTCAVCGSTDVAKAMMAPRVAKAMPSPAERGEGSARPTVPAKPSRQPTATAADPEFRRMLADMRKRIESQSDYVGERFAREARAIHLGETRERPIYGEATAADARQLLEDGVPVMPLPFIPTRKAN